MRISYEPGLEELASTLEEYGHELFPAGLFQESDAILYQHTIPRVPAAQDGAVIVCVKNQTSEQINAVLKTRLYSQLF